MSSRIERNAIIGSNQPFILRYSQNQEVMKRKREGERKAYGDKKASKANLRRLENEQQQRGILFHRALTYVLEGTPILEYMEHIEYVEKKWGRVLDRYTTEKGLEVTITIVDFTSQKKQ